MKKSFHYTILCALSLLSTALLAQDIQPKWRNISFAENSNINLLANYKQYLYAAGSNESDHGSSWLYNNSQWRNVYQAKDNSTAIDTTIVADKFYVAGNYPGKGSWLVEYLPKNNSSIDMHLNFANHISQIENLHELLFVSGADQQEHGAVWVYSPNKGWDKISPRGYNYISEMTITPNELLYAAAVNSKTNKAKIIVYSHPQKKWSDTYLPNNIVLVWSLVSDRHNIVYAAVMDKDYRAQIWKLTNNKWTSLKLDSAQSVSSLELDENGILYAAGQDDTFHGQVWSYINQNWRKINFPDSENVTSIVINKDRELYAVSKDSKNYSQVWTYKLPLN